MGKKKFNLVVVPERCKECGICYEFCPQKILEPDEEGRPVMVDPEACTGCRLCEYLCPDFAIRIIEEEGERDKAKKK